MSDKKHTVTVKGEGTWPIEVDGMTLEAFLAGYGKEQLGLSPDRVVRRFETGRSLGETVEFSFRESL